MAEVCSHIDSFDKFQITYSIVRNCTIQHYKASKGLVALERLWREHFLRVMKPKYLPEFWSLEHNVQRYVVNAFDVLTLIMCPYSSQIGNSSRPGTS